MRSRSRGKRLNLFCARVPKVAEHHHHFVVPQQGVHPPACLPRFAFQSHEQVQCATRFRAAIDHVADLHQMCASACPMEIGVDHPCFLENRDEPAVLPVDVADGDDPRDTGDAAGVEA